MGREGLGQVLGSGGVHGKGSVTVEGQTGVRPEETGRESIGDDFKRIPVLGVNTGEEEGAEGKTEARHEIRVMGALAGVEGAWAKVEGGAGGSSFMGVGDMEIIDK